MNEWLMLGQVTGQEGGSEGQTGTVQPGSPGTEGQGQQSLPGGPLIFIFLIMAIFYFVLMRPQKKRQQEHKKMLGELKKNDRVRTIGGIIGTVVDIRDYEVVVKIDESTNTKMRFLRSAIAVVNPESPDEEK